MNSPVFFKLYEESAKGKPLAAAQLGNPAVLNLGVAPGSKDKFVQSFTESAVAAGLAVLNEDGQIVLESLDAGTDGGQPSSEDQSLDNTQGRVRGHRSQMGVICWVYPNLVLANSPVGVEIIDILPGTDPVSCTVRHGWMATSPWTDDEGRAGYEAIYEQVHAVVRDEDFTMLPSCGAGVRHGQHGHMLIGRTEIGVQHLMRTLAGKLGIALDDGAGV